MICDYLFSHHRLFISGLWQYTKLYYYYCCCCCCYILLNVAVPKLTKVRFSTQKVDKPKTYKDRTIGLTLQVLVLKLLSSTGGQKQ